MIDAKNAVCIALASLAVLVAAGGASLPALAQSPAFVAPPRTIADITAILDQEKPDSKLLANYRAAAEAEPPKGGSPNALHQFYLERGRARSELGRLRQAVEDGERAVKAAQQAGLEFRDVANTHRFLILQFQIAGEYTTARNLLAALERDIVNSGRSQRGMLVPIYRWTVTALLNKGDMAQAEGYFRRMQALVAEARGWGNAYALYGTGYESELERARAEIANAKGQFREAEAAFRRASVLVRDVLDDKLHRWPGTQATTREQFENRLDVETSLQARAKANQGRLAEAEADIRRSLLSRLKQNGKYSGFVAGQLMQLGGVLAQQGRYAEAEQLTREELEIRRSIGTTADSEAVVGNLRRLSTLSSLQDKHEHAARLDDEIDRIIQKWEPQRRQHYEIDNNRVYALLQAGRNEDGLAAAERLAKMQAQRAGDEHLDTALARGFLAIALFKAGRDGDAIVQFKRAVPALLAASRNTDIDESAVSAQRNARIRDIVESYIAALARSPATDAAEVAGEGFRVIDAVRGRSVQHAVASATARMVAKDKALADLVRRDQDHELQINAQLGLVNSLLGLPPGERDDAVIRKINVDIGTLRSARAATRADLARRFPSYAELIDPKPPTEAEIRAALRSGEALLSFYFGREHSFVWALPKDGRLVFSPLKASGTEIEAKIARLRQAVEIRPGSTAALPAFDLTVASDLYELLLQPVEAGWRDATSLIVVTNGALGLLPLSLLPRQRVTWAPAVAGPRFAAYRDVPWLARTHAVTMVPSAVALKALRQVPPGASSREPLIGFGDPIFEDPPAEDAARAAVAQVAAAEPGSALRRRTAPNTAHVDSAELARLPRLPDTADELKAIAAALRADPARVLHLGKAAHERAVTSADLARYRIVAFATHGLLPGDLNGLTQPALALTAPLIAGVDGDGLLTMGEVLGLKLDADWVLLSACNTGAGSSTGAEALSGLARAFFYAGTRALLITNWSVDSLSARDLVIDLFRRQSENPGLGRGQALRQAQVAMIDGGGNVANGRMTVSYAHPLFWAAYSVIGEGG